MIDHIRFLTALSADPRGDVHRLIYADWLEEQGHPLSDLLRLQYDIASRREGDEDVPALHQREKEALRKQEIPFRTFLANLLELEVAIGHKFEKDVLSLSRRDPVQATCPSCANDGMWKWTQTNPLALHWIINPGLAFNELVLGQRVPRVMFLCLQCHHSYTRCVACRRLHDLQIWGKGFQYADFACPDCQAPIPMLRNLVAGAVVGVTSLAARAVAAIARRRSGV